MQTGAAIIPFSVDPVYGNVYLILGRDGRQWGHLGGRRDGLESPETTAIREFMEESIGLLGDVDLDEFVFQVCSVQPMASQRYRKRGITQSRYNAFVVQLPWMPDRVKHLSTTLPILKTLGEDLVRARAITNPEPVTAALNRFKSEAEVLTISAPSLDFDCGRCTRIESLLPQPKTHYCFSNNRLMMCKRFELATCCMSCMEEYCDRCEESGEVMIPMRALVVLESSSVVAVELAVPISATSWIYSRLNRYKAIQYAIETELPAFKIVSSLGGHVLDMHVRAKYVEKSEVQYISLPQILATLHPSGSDSEDWRTPRKPGRRVFDRNRFRLNPAHAELIQTVASHLQRLVTDNPPEEVDIVLQDPHELDERLPERPGILLEHPL